VWWLGNEEWKSLAVVMGASLLLTAALVLVIKFSVRRKRPHGEWGEIYRRTDPHSFPSGHAARAALLAVIALGLGPAWFGILLLIWAPLVILARVSMGVHYLSDVLAGALLGGIIGLVVVKIIPLLASAA
jgi:undecaprenyl-diphosphatase